jgi:chlorophyllide a reductase subunit Y
MVVNAAIAGKDRFNRMSAFFEGVGTGHGAGIWEETPQDRPSFKKKYAALNEAARKAAEAVGS